MTHIFCPKPIRKCSPITIKAAEDVLEPFEITQTKMFHYFSYKLKKDPENKFLIRDVERLAPKVKNKFRPIEDI